MKFEVQFAYSGVLHYLVEAESSEAAIEKAEHRYYDGDEPDITGREYERIDSTTVVNNP